MFIVGISLVAPYILEKNERMNIEMSRKGQSDDFPLPTLICAI